MARANFTRGLGRDQRFPLRSPQVPPRRPRGVGPSGLTTSLTRFPRLVCPGRLVWPRLSEAGHCSTLPHSRSYLPATATRLTTRPTPRRLAHDSPMPGVLTGKTARRRRRHLDPDLREHRSRPLGVAPLSSKRVRQEHEQRNYAQILCSFPCVTYGKLRPEAARVQCAPKPPPEAPNLSAPLRRSGAELRRVSLLRPGGCQSRGPARQ